MEDKDYEEYKGQYDEQALMTKISRFAKDAGLKAIYNVLILYNTFISKNTSIATKAMIVGALGYFICPLDVIPDLMPGLGYMDDMSALAFTVNKIITSITPEIRKTAKEQLKKWFDFKDEDLDERVEE